jgi:hypothetical protein
MFVYVEHFADINRLQMSMMLMALRNGVRRLSVLGFIFHAEFEALLATVAKNVIISGTATKALSSYTLSEEHLLLSLGLKL